MGVLEIHALGHHWESFHPPSAPLPSTPRRSHRRRDRPGVLVTLALAEVGLGRFVTPLDAVLPDIAADSASAAIVTVRQIEEGVATTHFSAGGARLTGNAWLAGAPTVVVIGDSYVVAREVPDELTMGAWLERRARNGGIPVDVRQYGWRGASPARYVSSAPAVLSRWNPSAVVVPLSADDLDEHAVGGTRPYLALEAEGDATVVGAAAAALTSSRSRRDRSSPGSPRGDGVPSGRARRAHSTDGLRRRRPSRPRRTRRPATCPRTPLARRTIP